MASLSKRAKSPYWVACYRGLGGERCQRSTKTTDKSIALKMALEWERAQRMAREGQASTFQFQKIINDLNEQVVGETLPSPTCETYFEDWLAGIKRKNTETTIERYKNSVTLFVRSLGSMARQPVRSLTPTHIENFLNRRLDSGVAPKTAIIDIKTISCALRRAENYRLIDKNPCPAVKLPKNISSERGIFSAEEVHRLLNACPNQDWQTLILLGFYLGARLGDCVRMTWDNIDVDNGMIVYEQKKTGKRVAVPIHYNLLKHILNLSQTHTKGFLCPSIAAKTPGGKHGLSESFKRIVKRADVDLGIIKGKGNRNFTQKTFHSLRHSFNSVMANAGISEEVRMKLTGHTSRETHSRYTHINADPLKHAISKLPMVGVKDKTPSAGKKSDPAVTVTP